MIGSAFDRGIAGERAQRARRRRSPSSGRCRGGRSRAARSRRRSRGRCLCARRARRASCGVGSGSSAVFVERRRASIAAATALSALTLLTERPSARSSSGSASSSVRGAGNGNSRTPSGLDRRRVAFDHAAQDRARGVDRDLLVDDRVARPSPTATGSAAGLRRARRRAMRVEPRNARRAARRTASRSTSVPSMRRTTECGIHGRARRRAFEPHGERVRRRCSTDSSVGACGSPSSRRYAAPSKTSTTLVERRRSTIAVRSSRYGVRTGTTASRTERWAPCTSRRTHATGGSTCSRCSSTGRTSSCGRGFTVIYHATAIAALWVTLRNFPSINGWDFRADGVHVRPVDARARRCTTRSSSRSAACPSSCARGASTGFLVRPLDPLFQALTVPQQIWPDELILAIVYFCGRRRRTPACTSTGCFRVRAAGRAGRRADRLRHQPRDRDGVVLVHPHRLAALGVHVARTGVLALPDLDLPARRALVLAFVLPFAFMNYFPATFLLHKTRDRAEFESGGRAAHAAGRRRLRSALGLCVLARRHQPLSRNGKLTMARIHVHDLADRL